MHLTLFVMEKSRRGASGSEVFPREESHVSLSKPHSLSAPSMRNITLGSWGMKSSYSSSKSFKTSDALRAVYYPHCPWKEGAQHQV
ncbi:hypothetical protein KIL84_019352 [Mauremys mutica]|uniref:Uncharacterized protein n=1 Tax=Mauremys mutica TaxID=74926 RepID=A0A9D3XUY3_9SAUR|nr:hypothetical protein KIL84_019352 [Mauremys mutica]